MSEILVWRALVIVQGKILVVRKTQNEMWMLPTGVFQHDDQQQKAIKRELLKQTGYHATSVSDQPITLTDLDYKIGNQLFLAEIQTDQSKSGYAMDCEFMTIEDFDAQLVEHDYPISRREELSLTINRILT